MQDTKKPNLGDLNHTLVHMSSQKNFSIEECQLINQKGNTELENHHLLAANEIIGKCKDYQ